MAFPGDITVTTRGGSTANLILLPSQADGIVRRTLVGDSATPMKQTTFDVSRKTIKATTARPYPVYSYTITAKRADDNGAFPAVTYFDTVSFTFNVAGIVDADLTYDARLEKLLLLVGQYLHGEAFVAADVTGGKYSVGIADELLMGQA